MDVTALIGMATGAAKEVPSLVSNNSSSGRSVTGAVKDTLIQSRVYIDGSVENDPILKSVLNLSHSMYVAFLLNVLKLSNLVTQDVKVKDFLKPIATEGDVSYQSLLTGLQKYVGSEEGINDYMGMPSSEPKGEAGFDSITGNYEKKRTDTKATPTPQAEKKKSIADLDVKDVTPKIDGSIPLASVHSISFNNPQVPDSHVTIDIIIQMVPYIVKPAMIDVFIGLNAQPTFRDRYLMWKAGEISFFKDLLLGLDIARGRRKTMLSDKEGMLVDFINTQVKKSTKVGTDIYEDLATRYANKSGGASDRFIRSNNVANTVMIFSENAVQRVKSTSGFDIHNKAHRGKYFDSTFTMFIFVINTNFNQVTLYMNGIDAVMTYPYEVLKKDKKFDGQDFMQIMTSMARNQAPRF